MSNPVRFRKMSSLVVKLISVSVRITSVAALHSQQPLSEPLTIHWGQGDGCFQHHPRR